jgi:hypothetical protein
MNAVVHFNASGKRLGSEPASLRRLVPVVSSFAVEGQCGFRFEKYHEI